MDLKDYRITRLACAVVIRAARDASQGNPEAVAWLAGPAAEFYFDVIKMDQQLVLSWLAADCPSPHCSRWQ